MLTTHALETVRTCIQKNVAYAQYKVNGSYYQADIRSTQVLDDGRLAITFVIDSSLSGSITVQEVQLYDHSGKLWASKTENIERGSISNGILYRFTFLVTEG